MVTTTTTECKVDSPWEVKEYLEKNARYTGDYKRRENSNKSRVVKYGEFAKRENKYKRVNNRYNIRGRDVGMLYMSMDRGMNRGGSFGYRSGY